MAALIRPQHSPEFKSRRTQNWLALGLTYAAMYMARYNFPLANKALSDTYGWDKAQVGAMWAMLCEGVKARGRDVWRLEFRDVTGRSAHWEASYRFSATGRMVHNVIDAEFDVDVAGLITRQRDRFDFWRWSRQALGAPGLLLGWTPMLRAKVRAQAARNLTRFLASTPSPSGRGPG